MNYKHTKNRFITYVDTTKLWAKKAYIHITTNGKIAIYVPDNNSGNNYANIERFFKVWTIVDRRVLIEKTGYYL